MYKLFLFLSLSVGAYSQCLTTGDPGCVRFEWKTSSATDIMTNSVSPTEAQWFTSHMYRIMGYSPYWDTKVSWFPNSWFYQDSSSLYTYLPITTQHPEWILKNAAGQPLYISWGCGGGTCPQYAPDYSNAAFRAWWIAQAQTSLKAGYRGIFMDDVNLEMNLSNGSSADIPVDPNTGSLMTEAAWEQYIASFLSAVRQNFPNIEIVHNALWYAGNFSPANNANVMAEVKASNYVNLERGFGDPGLAGDNGDWSIQNFMRYIDAVHAAGGHVLLEQYSPDGQFSLAGYLLINDGVDLFGQDSTTPGTWNSDYDVDLGPAINTHYGWQGLIRRDFQNGIVLMNTPGAATITVTLPGAFKDTGGNSLTTASLPGRTGLILLGKIVTPPAPPLIADGSYIVTNANSGLVLDVPNWSTKAGVQIDQWPLNNGANQLWKFANQGGGYETIQSYSDGLYLTSSGGKLVQNPKDNADDQLWKITQTNGGFFIVNKATNQAIDDAAWSKAKGLLIITWPLNKGMNQVWSVK